VRLRIWSVGLIAALALAGAAHGEDSEAEARARKRCEKAAEARGLKVEKVGKPEKVGKKAYELKLRIKQKEKKADDYHVICRYDDKAREAEIR